MPEDTTSIMKAREREKMEKERKTEGKQEKMAAQVNKLQHCVERRWVKEKKDKIRHEGVGDGIIRKTEWGKHIGWKSERGRGNHVTPE